MSENPVDLETLKALAFVQGLTLSDERLAQLLPLVQRTVEGRPAIEALDLGDTPPAMTFWPLDS